VLPDGAGTHQFIFKRSNDSTRWRVSLQIGYPTQHSRRSTSKKLDLHMTRNDFLRILEHEMEVPEGSLHESDAIADLSVWDSMTGVIFIALADEKLGLIVSGAQIARSKTINDLMSLLSDRLVA
jgi:hypothetical protein